MSALFGSKPRPPVIAPAATDNTELVKAAARREADRLRKRRGFRSTIATGSGGVTGAAPGFKTELG